MPRLANKTAIITGGAGGMGEAHVRRFLHEGANVHFTDVLREEGEALAAELGARARFTFADVASATDWAGLIAETEDAYGQVDILVNNAGIVIRAPIEEMLEAEYRKVVDINQVGVFLGMKAVIPSMRRAGAGSIINISSIAGLVGRPQTVAYAASKFAVRGMTKVAANELGADNIRVNSVHPGPVLTPMFQNMDQKVRDDLTDQIPLGRMARPEEVSDLIVFLASDESTYCSGAEFLIDGGMLAG
jgi:3alpha(or 20beta)-hydroxysteroid dehydrogenase